MFRFGPFGAQGLNPTLPGAQAPKPGGGGNAELFRLGVMLALALVVGALSLGFFMKGASGRASHGVESTATPANAPRSIPVEDLRVTHVPDPGDPDADAPGPAAPDEAAGRAGPFKPPPFKEDPKIYDAVEQYGSHIEREAACHLMHKVVTTDPIALHKEARELSFLKFFNDPDSLIGKPVKFTGSLFAISGVDQDLFPADPMRNPSGVDAPQWGYVVDPGFRPCHFYAPAIPTNVRTKDIVTLEGYFFKIHTFENSSGNQMRAPLLVVRSIVKLPPETLDPIIWFGIPLKIGSHVMTWLEVGLLMAIIVSMPIVIWYVRVERRNYLEFRQKSIQRRRKGLPKDAPPGADDPPASPPAATGGPPDPLPSAPPPDPPPS